MSTIPKSLDKARYALRRWNAAAKVKSLRARYEAEHLDWAGSLAGKVENDLTLASKAATSEANRHAQLQRALYNLVRCQPYNSTKYANRNDPAAWRATEMFKCERGIIDGIAAWTPPIPPPPPPPPPPRPVADMFTGRTAYVGWGLANGSLGTVEHFVRWAKTAPPDKGGPYTCIALQAWPGNVDLADDVKAMCAAHGLHYAIWFDMSHPGDTLEQIAWYRPQGFIWNVEVPEGYAGRNYAAEITRFRANHPAMPSAVCTNWHGIYGIQEAQLWINAGIICHVECYLAADPLHQTIPRQSWEATWRGWEAQEIVPVMGVYGGYSLSDYPEHTDRYGVYLVEYL